MAKTTEPRKKMYNQFIRPEKKLPKTDTRTMTTPHSNLTLRQIKERYTQGMPITGMGTGDMFYDDGNSSGRDPRTMDFNDIQALQQETYEKVQYLTEKVKSQQQRRAEQMQKHAELRKEAFRKDMEDYMKEKGLLKGSTNIT